MHQISCTFFKFFPGVIPWKPFNNRTQNHQSLRSLPLQVHGCMFKDRSWKMPMNLLKSYKKVLEIDGYSKVGTLVQMLNSGLSCCTAISFGTTSCVPESKPEYSKIEGN